MAASMSWRIDHLHEFVPGPNLWIRRQPLRSSSGSSLMSLATGPASVRRETCALTLAPDVPITTGRAGLRPGRALVPYAGAGTPAVDDASAAGRTMATGP